MMADFFGWPHPNEHQVITKDRLKEKVLRIIVAGNLPFSFAEQPEFQQLLTDAYPDCNPLPNRKTMTEYLKSKATATKLDLKDRLVKNTSKVSLALDVWTTRTNLAFLGTFLFHYYPVLREYALANHFLRYSRYIVVTGIVIITVLQLRFPLHFIVD
jgi:hypothetical protein